MITTASLSNGKELVLKWKPPHGGAPKVVQLLFLELIRFRTQFKMKMSAGKFIVELYLKRPVLQTAQTLFG